MPRLFDEHLIFIIEHVGGPNWQRQRTFYQNGSGAGVVSIQSEYGAKVPGMYCTHVLIKRHQ